MFSGIVEEIGCVKSVEHKAELSTLWIKASVCFEDTKIGDSISVNGTCLTVCEMDIDSFMFQAIPETIKLTNLGLLVTGMNVNLERSITPATRIGGHFVQGHVDGKTRISSIESEGDSLKVWFEKPEFLNECFVPKGYIAIDGMSLTIVDVTQNAFSICFIPHTQAVTIVKNYKPGTWVNIEIDHITKTVVQILNNRKENA